MVLATTPKATPKRNARSATRMKTMSKLSAPTPPLVDSPLAAEESNATAGGLGKKGCLCKSVLLFGAAAWAIFCVLGLHAPLVTSPAFIRAIEFATEASYIVFRMANGLLYYFQSLISVDKDELVYFASQMRDEYGMWTDIVMWTVVLVTLGSVGTFTVFQLRSKLNTTKTSLTRKSASFSAKHKSHRYSSAAGSDMDDSDIDDDDEATSDEEYPPIPNERGDIIFVSNKLSASEYEKETESKTRSELVKLLQSPEFRGLVQSKGKDVTAYNWQKRTSKPRRLSNTK